MMDLMECPPYPSSCFHPYLTEPFEDAFYTPSPVTNELVHLWNILVRCFGAFHNFPSVVLPLTWNTLTCWMSIIFLKHYNVNTFSASSARELKLQVQQPDLEVTPFYDCTVHSEWFVQHLQWMLCGVLTGGTLFRKLTITKCHIWRNVRSFLPYKTLVGEKNSIWSLCQFQVTSQCVKAVAQYMLHHFQVVCGSQEKSQCLNLSEPYAQSQWSPQILRWKEELSNRRHLQLCSRYQRHPPDRIRCFTLSGLYLRETWGVGDLSLQRRWTDPDPAGNWFFCWMSPIVLRQFEFIDAVCDDYYPYAMTAVSRTDCFWLLSLQGVK